MPREPPRDQRALSAQSVHRRLLHELADEVLDAEMQLLRAVGARRRNDDGMIGELAQRAAVARAEREHADAARCAALAARSTFGELPLVEWMISRSPGFASASTCRAKTCSKPKSFAAAVSSDVSVVSATAGYARRLRM